MTNLLNKTSIKEKLLVLVAIGAGLVSLLFIVTVSWIGYTVDETCREAINKYGGVCVEALQKTVLNTNESFRERNDAIWALGQLGDSSALPTLKSVYTGDIPDREPLNETLSQYELKKAIKLLEGGTNITAYFWR